MTVSSAAEMAAAIWEHLVGQAEGFTRLQPGGEVIELPGVLVALSGGRLPWTNRIFWVGTEPDDLDRAIGEVVRLLQERRLPAMWQVLPTSWPTDLAERLGAAGFVLGETIPWMAAPVDRIAAPPVPVDLEIRRVQTASEHESFLDAMEAGFGRSPGLREALGPIGIAVGFDEAGPWIRFVGWIGGRRRPVASSGLIVHSGVAAIHNVATDPKHRRRGVGAAMTFAAARHAGKLRYNLVTLGTSAMGRRIYDRLGFVEVCTISEYVWRPDR